MDAAALDGREPVSMRGYFEASRSWHFWGVAGGIVWCTGAVQFCRFARAYRRSCRFLLDQSGCNDDLGELGCVCVEGVRRLAGPIEALPHLDVCLFRMRVDRSRSCSHLPVALQ
jgi:hypothetical protein